jgi:glycosyltransferase involved in cell wall biosynthesis
MEYVEASKALKAQGVTLDFWLAGEPDPGNPNSVPLDIVRAWHEAGVVRALGHVNDKAEWLPHVDLAVHPSYYREGVPRSLIEAAACELPVITTDMPGCRDIVQHNVNGLLVPPRNANALAEAIRYILEHPDARRRMGVAGRDRVLREFDETMVLSKTLDVYRELVPGVLPYGTGSRSVPI